MIYLFRTILNNVNYYYICIGLLLAIKMAKIDKNKRVIDIADYLFANPSKERSDVLSKFGKKWQMSDRTVDRLIKDAKEYNSSRIRKQEEARNEVLAIEAKESIKRDIINRNEAKEILSKIAKGNNKTSPSDQVKAIQQLSKMEGWDAPIKNEISGGISQVTIFEIPDNGRDSNK